MRTLLICLLSLGLTWAMQAQTGASSDAITGIKAKWKGLAYQKAFLMDTEGNTVKRKAVPLGSVLILAISDVEGLSAKDGHEFMGAEVEVFEGGKKGKRIFHIADFYDEDTEGYPLGSMKIYAGGAPIAASDYQVGKNYLLRVRFFDKIGTGRITTEVNFRVTN